MKFSEKKRFIFLRFRLFFNKEIFKTASIKLANDKPSCWNTSASDCLCLFQTYTANSTWNMGNSLTHKNHKKNDMYPPRYSRSAKPIWREPKAPAIIATRGITANKQQQKLHEVSKAKRTQAVRSPFEMYITNLFVL